MQAKTSDDAMAHTASVRKTTPAAAQRIPCLDEGIARHERPAIRYETAAESGKSVPHAVMITGHVRITSAAVTPAATPARRRSSTYDGAIAMRASTKRKAMKPPTGPNRR